jgi:hypothetical protein
VEPRCGRRLADGREVDRLRPGEDEPKVPVDRVAGGPLNGQTERRQTLVEDAYGIGRQLGDVPETRRERFAWTGQGLPPRAGRTLLAPLPALSLRDRRGASV